MYDDLLLTATCFVSDPAQSPAIAAWLKGRGTVTFANRKGGYYKARIANQITFEKVLRGNPHRAFSVNFRCFPFWYQEDTNTTVADRIQAHVKSLSTLSVAITAAGFYGSTISSYRTSLDGVTYTAASFTASKRLSAAGGMAITVTALTAGAGRRRTQRPSRCWITRYPPSGSFPLNGAIRTGRWRR